MIVEREQLTADSGNATASGAARERAELKPGQLCSPKFTHGFTLVELLIVVGLIALLAGMLLPALARAKSHAQRTRCQSNLRQINAGVAMYADDHAGWMPAAAPHELGGPPGHRPNGRPVVAGADVRWRVAGERASVECVLPALQVFASPCDRGEPLWWFDTADYQAHSTCYQLYGSSYFYASGYNRVGGVVAPMGIAKFVGMDFSFDGFATNPLPLGTSLRADFYRVPARKVVVGSIPIYRTMSGVVALSRRAQW